MEFPIVLHLVDAEQSDSAWGRYYLGGQRSDYHMDAGDTNVTNVSLCIRNRQRHNPATDSKEFYVPGEDDEVRGQVRWFNNTKGYGFIGREDDGPDVFVHYSSIVGEGYKTLNEGDAVEFEIVQGPKGPQAGSVRRIDS